MESLYSQRFLYILNNVAQSHQNSSIHWTIDKMHSFKSFAEFCQDTSLHGWAHFNQSRNSKTALFVWFLIIMTSFGVAIFLNERYVYLTLSALKFQAPQMASLDLNAKVFISYSQNLKLDFWRTGCHPYRIWSVHSLNISLLRCPLSSKSRV